MNENTLKNARIQNQMTLGKNVMSHVLFDLDGNKESSAKSDNLLLVPDSSFKLPSVFSEQKKKHYRIGRNVHFANVGQKNNFIVYAPFPLGFWAIPAFTQGRFDKLILDRPEDYRNWRCVVTRLLLKNEKRRMGSDVFSPIMMRQLHKILSVADYFPLTIGDWLDLTKKSTQYLSRTAGMVLWLNGETPQQEISAFLGGGRKSAS